MTSRVTIAVCTRERPAELGELLDSLGRSRFRKVPRPDVEVLVVENGPTSGLDPDELARRCGWPVRVEHEPRPGVAYARNAAIAHRRPGDDWLVCVDDDQVVTPSWLDEHLAYAATTDADLVTGPVLVRLPEDTPEWARHLWRNVPRHETGSVQRSFLGGNVCFRGDLFDRTDLRYDETHATATADDADLGRRLTAAGHVTVWNDRAIAWERVHPARVRLRWMVERFLSFGGFEATFLRRHEGPAAVRRAIPRQVLELARGCWYAVTSLGDRPERRAVAIATTAHAAGWLGGALGWRVADYRRVTSA